MLLPRHRCFILLGDNIAYILCLVTIFSAVGAILAIFFCGIVPIHTSDSLEKAEVIENTVALRHIEDAHAETRKEICEPLPPTDDDAKCGNRVADRKCCEYKRAMNNKDEIMRNLRSNGLLTILGGKNASPGDFPHMVAVGWLYQEKLVYKYVFLCGGSLISNKFVLTAAHCTSYNGKGVLEPIPRIVRMGSEYISDKVKDRNRKNVRIKNITTHPSYNPKFYYYDVALLELRSEVIFTKKIHPACLSTSLTPTKFTEVNITGWGFTDKDSKQMPDRLQVATVNMIKYETCEKKLVEDQSGNWVFRTHQLCAGVEGGGIDTCQGDSGGPIQVKVCTTSGSMHSVIGVTSAGHRCGLPDSPGIYISVVSVLTWIENIVWPEDYHKLRGFRRNY
ncbi:anionic trypsin-2-like [Epargyreus clarus]|uniref:anionic trypsin-2-like n=1 Tax=Epargyreus clarus TaxID=520877 RepID=UPI003C2F37D4